MKLGAIAVMFAALLAVTVRSPSARGQERKIASFKLPSIGGVVTTPDTKKLIVSLPSEGKLAFFDLMKDEEIKRLAVDFRPTVMALQGKKLIVAAQGSPVLHVLDLDSLEELKSIKLPTVGTQPLGQPIQWLACHPTKGLIYALNLSYEVFAVDIVAGAGHKTKARADRIAVDPIDDKFLYAGLVRPFVDIPALSKMTTSGFTVKYAISGHDLVLKEVNNNAASTGPVFNQVGSRRAFGLGLSPDGKQIAFATVIGWRVNNQSPRGVGIFETSDIKKLVGVVETGENPAAIAFHPVLSLGAVYVHDSTAKERGEGRELVIFNRKSKLLAIIEKISVLPGSSPPVFLDFGAEGTKAILCPLPEMGDDTPKKTEAVLQFIPLKLSDEDKDALKNARWGTSELNSIPPKKEPAKPKM